MEEMLAEVNLLVCTGHCAVVVGDALVAAARHRIEGVQVTMELQSEPASDWPRPAVGRRRHPRKHPARASNVGRLRFVASSLPLTRAHISRHALPRKGAL